MSITIHIFNTPDDPSNGKPNAPNDTFISIAPDRRAIKINWNIIDQTVEKLQKETGDIHIIEALQLSLYLLREQMINDFSKTGHITEDFFKDKKDDKSD